MKQNNSLIKSNNMIEDCMRWSVKKPEIIMAVVMVITIIMTGFASTLEMDPSLDAMFPD